MNNICCAVAIFLMVLIIIVNLTLIVQIYFFKEELPDIFGAFPLIFLNDAGTPLVQNGDFVICQKIDDENISYLKEGDIVTHFADVGHTKLLVCKVKSVNGNTATLLPQTGGKQYDLTADDIVGSVRLSIPILGFIVYFLSTVPGFLLCVVIPVFALTEFYLYRRRKADKAAYDEESMLLSELEWQKAERERLLALLNKPRKRTLLHILGASITALCVTVPVATLFGLHLKPCPIQEILLFIRELFPTANTDSNMSVIEVQSFRSSKSDAYYISANAKQLGFCRTDTSDVPSEKRKQDSIPCREASLLST